MSDDDLVELGSATARAGFKTERDVARQFNDWRESEDARNWLTTMGYSLKEIKDVKAVVLPHHYKTDVQVRITIYLTTAVVLENLSVKLCSNPQGFNQVDKRWVDKYANMWNIPQSITKALKYFTGEISPIRHDIRDSRRLFLDEMDFITQNLIISFFERNKILIVSDVLKGNDDIPVNWMLVILNCENEQRWVLKPINFVLNYFGGGEVRITDRGSLKIGRITMQRKGGDGGRPTANMLQFKINPAELFNSFFE